MNPDTFNPAVSHIVDSGNIFQVLNADGTDWDEAATAKAYEQYLTLKVTVQVQTLVANASIQA